MTSRTWLSIMRAAWCALLCLAAAVAQGADPPTAKIDGAQDPVGEDSARQIIVTIENPTPNATYHAVVVQPGQPQQSIPLDPKGRGTPITVRSKKEGDARPTVAVICTLNNVETQIEKKEIVVDKKVERTTAALQVDRDVMLAMRANAPQIALSSGLSSVLDFQDITAFNGTNVLTPLSSLLAYDAAFLFNLRLDTDGNPAGYAVTITQLTQHLFPFMPGVLDLDLASQLHDQLPNSGSLVFNDTLTEATLAGDLFVELAILGLGDFVIPASYNVTLDTDPASAAFGRAQSVTDSLFGFAADEPPLPALVLGALGVMVVVLRRQRRPAEARCTGDAARRRAVPSCSESAPWPCA
jgi:hypothetical protein